MDAMNVAQLGAIGTIVFTVVNFMKSLTNKNYSAVVTQAISWLAGIIVIVLAAKTEYAEQIKIGLTTLKEAGASTLIFLGLQASSILGTVKEALKAIDSRDTQVQPPLIPSLSKEVE